MDSRSMYVLAWCTLGFLVAQPVVGQTSEQSASDKPALTYRLVGVVTDGSREPIPEAEILVVESGKPEQPTTTDSRGRFDLGLFAAGPVSFRVRRLGYQQRTIAAQVGADGHNTSVEIVLVSVPLALANVEVSSGPVGRLQEFYQRRQQRGTFGKFIEQDEIRKRGPANASDLFRSVPGVNISANPTGGNAIRIRSCKPMVLIDAQRVPGAELDEVISPGDIAAIEFYPSSAGVPAQYMERANRLCGLILVWTRNQ